MRHGIWIDDAPATCIRGGYVGSLADIGIDIVGVAIDGFHRGFRSRWRASDGEVFADLCERQGIERVLTFAAEPTEAYLDDLEQRLPDLIAAFRPTRLEPDTEGPYKRQHVRGFRSLQEASNRLIEIVEATGLEMQLTTFPDHGEAKPSRSTLGKAVRHFALQVYSNKNFLGREIPFQGHALSPGTFQERELAEWTEAWSGMWHEPWLIAALAAYEQDWDERDPVQAMRLAYMASAARPNVAEVWWWSSKFVVGGQKARAPWAAGAIRQLTGRESAKPPIPPMGKRPNLDRIQHHAEGILEEIAEARS